MRLEAIHLVSILSLLSQGNAGTARTCSPLWLLCVSFLSFSSPLFLLPLQFLWFHFSPSLVLFRVIAPPVATSASAFLRRLYFAPSCSEAILPLLSGAFFIAVFHPLFLFSDFPSHICGSYWYSQIQPAYRAIWSDFGGIMEEGKQHSHQREKLRGRKEKWWNTTFHTCVHHTAGLIIINE